MTYESYIHYLERMNQTVMHWRNWDTLPEDRVKLQGYDRAHGVGFIGCPGLTQLLQSQQCVLIEPVSMGRLRDNQLGSETC